MANRADIDCTYSLTDRVFRLSLGELAAEDTAAPPVGGVS
jgi:hypothetical protein